MGRRLSVSTRRSLLAAGGIVGAATLTACAERAPTFILEPTPAAAAPLVKMQRLLLWLPSGDKSLEWSFLASQLAKALAPYGVAVETGRAHRLEISRSDDQKAMIESFKPTYRLEIDLVVATSTTIGTTTNVRANMVGTLYEGASRTPLARFHHRARSNVAPELVPEIVEMFRKGGYL